MMANWRITMVTSKQKGLCTTWLEKLASPYLQMHAQNSIKPLKSTFFIREAKSLFCLQIRSGHLFFVEPSFGVAPLLDFCLSEQL